MRKITTLPLFLLMLSPGWAMEQKPTFVVPSQAARDHISEELRAAGTSRHQASKENQPAIVRNITVSRDKGAVEVRIEGSQAPQFTATVLSDPKRIVIDLANTGMSRPRRVAIRSGDVQDVQGSLYLVNPLVTRVIVNLTRAHAYRLLPSGNTLTLRIEDASPSE